jgi:MFS family permease
MKRLTRATLLPVRMVQAFGSSAVLAIGAGSLADMYERSERGTKVGLNISACLLFRCLAD